MIEAFFAGLGNVFATGVGILLLGAITGALFVLWDWRVALVGAVFVHLGACSILVLVHDVPGLVAAGQMLAVTLAAAMLASAGVLHPNAKSLHQAGNWPLRLMALIFVVVAWWYLDPGYTLPYFSQPETDFLLWTGDLCAGHVELFRQPIDGGRRRAAVVDADVRAGICLAAGIRAAGRRWHCGRYSGACLQLPCAARARRGAAAMRRSAARSVAAAVAPLAAAYSGGDAATSCSR